MKKIFLDINFICDLIISRKTSEASRSKIRELANNEDNVFLATSSLSTIFYIANNTHKDNAFAKQQMDFLRNEALDCKNKLNKDNAFEIADFFIREVLKEPAKTQEYNIAETIYDICKNVVMLVPLSSKASFRALEYCKNNPKADLEDILQYFVAKENGCEEILTNDKKFPKIDIALVDSYGNRFYMSNTHHKEEKTKESLVAVAKNKLINLANSIKDFFTDNKDDNKNKPKRNKQ